MTQLPLRPTVRPKPPTCKQPPQQFSSSSQVRQSIQRRFTASPRSNLSPPAYISPAVGLIWAAARFPVDIWVIAPARISLQISLEDLCCSHTLGRTAVT